MSLVRGPVVFLAALAVLSCSDTGGPPGSPSFIFDWLRDGNRDIYWVNLEGQNTHRLTDDPGEDQQPTGGGGSVVFTSYRDANAELYQIPVGGGITRRLTTTTANETEPALSRDGSRLAFISDVSGVPKLWTSSPDGSNAQRVTGSFGFGGSIEASPSWSPNGDRVVFVATNSGTADLYVVTPGNAPVALVSSESADVEPAWGPDGSAVAFVSDRDGDPEIYLVTVESGQTRRLTNRAGIDAQPAWLADGRLVYTAWVDGTPRLRWLDPASSAGGTDVGPGTGGEGAQHPAAIF